MTLVITVDVMNDYSILKLIRENLLVNFGNEDFPLDSCEKCKKVVLLTDEYNHFSRKMGEEFLDRCLVCNLKLCYECTRDSCTFEPTYCKECRKNSDLKKCLNCKRMCFDYCTISGGEPIEIDGILCCRHCELTLFTELEEAKKKT